MREQNSSSKQTESLNWVSWGVNWFALFGPHVFLQPIRMAPSPSQLTASHFRSSPHHFLSNKTLPVPAALVCLLLLPHSYSFSSHTPVFTTNPTVIHCAFSRFLLVTSYKVKCLPSFEDSTCKEKLLMSRLCNVILESWNLYFADLGVLYTYIPIFFLGERTAHSS
jgi:hypothetical protein